MENCWKRCCLSLLCTDKLNKVDDLNKVVITIYYVCSMRSSSLQCFRATCLCAVQFIFMNLDNALWGRLLGQQLVGYYENRYQSRGTISPLWSLSIGILSNNRVRAVTTIAYCATDMLVEVYISIGIVGTNITWKRLPIDYRSSNTFLSPPINTYWLGVRWYRSIPANVRCVQRHRSVPIAQFNRFSRYFDRYLLTI